MSQNESSYRNNTKEAKNESSGLKKLVRINESFSKIILINSTEFIRKMAHSMNCHKLNVLSHDGNMPSWDKYLWQIIFLFIE